LYESFSWTPEGIWSAEFPPQFTHKGKTRIVPEKAKETKNNPFQKNDVRVMTDVTSSETFQLSSFQEICELAVSDGPVAAVTWNEPGMPQAVRNRLRHGSVFSLRQKPPFHNVGLRIGSKFLDGLPGLDDKPIWKSNRLDCRLALGNWAVADCYHFRLLPGPLLG
jgi:hypothetical protein